MRSAMHLLVLVALVALASGCRSGLSDFDAGFPPESESTQGSAAIPPSYFLSYEALRRKYFAGPECDDGLPKGIPRYIADTVTAESLHGAATLSLMYCIDFDRDFSLSSPRGACFVAVDAAGNAGGWTPAPEPVLTALRSAGYDILPLGLARIPAKDEQDIRHPGRFRLVEHAQTGEPGRIYHCEIITAEPTIALVRIGCYRGPLASSGALLILGKVGDDWKIIHTWGTWVS